MARYPVDTAEVFTARRFGGKPLVVLPDRFCCVNFF